MKWTVYSRIAVSPETVNRSRYPVLPCFVLRLRTFKVRSRRYRNRRIGEFLKELHLTEGRNTGFKKILEALKKNGSPLPEFETDEYHDYFITRLFVREGFYDYQKDNDEDQKDTQSANGTLNGTLNNTEDKKQRLKELISANPKITRKEMSKELEMSERSIQRLLNTMPEIYFTGGGRSGHWEIEE